MRGRLAGGIPEPGVLGKGILVIVKTTERLESTEESDALRLRLASS
jgi:hypothetical protein